MTAILERVLKDSFEREAKLSTDVTRVSVDTRLPTHDVVNVYIRGMVAGRIVADKADAVTIARRLIPDSLRFEKEPATITRDVVKLAEAYIELMIEARTAVSTRDVQSLAAFLRKHDSGTGGAPIHPDWAVFVSDWRARSQDEDTKQALSPST